jgi:hypothetical protein
LRVVGGLAQDGSLKSNCLCPEDGDNSAIMVQTVCVVPPAMRS